MVSQGHTHITDHIDRCNGIAFYARHFHQIAEWAYVTVNFFEQMALRAGDN